MTIVLQLPDHCLPLGFGAWILKLNYYVKKPVYNPEDYFM